MITFESYIAKIKKNNITDLSLDARQTNASTAFVAIPGTQKHGLDYLQQALENNANTVIIDADDSAITAYDVPAKINIIKIPKLINHQGDFAAEFYNQPSQKLKIHAITGTNGKTSCSQFIAQALTLLGEKCGVIGTLGIGVYPELIANSNTTPDAIQLQRFLHHCVTNNILHVSMEASSIALAAGRIQGCQIESAIFTNLTQDHLDYHFTMDAYGAAKKMLFEFPNLKHVIINADDAFGQQLLQKCADKLFCIAYSTKSALDWQGASVTTESSRLNQQGIEASIELRSLDSLKLARYDEFDMKLTHADSLNIQSSLIGAFNLSNLLAVIGWLMTQNISLQNISSIISKLKPVDGRMQRVSKADKPTIIIDYAHTPDALAQALNALRGHCQGELWCVFGCGGNRDKTKRPLMGEVAAELADHIIITNDNPRMENPEHIAHDIFTGIPAMCMKVDLELDRYKAIQLAIAEAKPDDIILIAGKGHEDYQDIQGIKHHFSDIEVAQELL